MNYFEINSFLQLGYVPKPDTKFLDPVIQDIWSFRKLKERQRKKSKKALVKEGISILNKIFTDFISQSEDPEKIQFVPLSGGLDSRLILGFLIEKVGREKLLTGTFGSPGTLDFDIPIELTSKFKVKHEKYDLTKVPVDISCLNFSIDRGSFGTELITAYFNNLFYKKHYNNVCYWSGFLGGQIAGSNYKLGNEKLAWIESKKLFLEKNNWLPKNHKPIFEESFQIFSQLPKEPFISDPNIVSFFEQLDLSVRQPSWIYKVVCAQGENYFTPFSHPDWVSFILATPQHLRENCRLYHYIMQDKFPDLFKFRSKTYSEVLMEKHIAIQLKEKLWTAKNKFLGFFSKLPPNQKNHKDGKKINPMLNYLDFAHSFRSRPDLIRLAEVNLSELENSNKTPWLKPNEILESHLKLRDDFSQEILLLISLNANLKRKNYGEK